MIAAPFAAIFHSLLFHLRIQETGYSVQFTFKDVSEVDAAIQFALANNLTDLYDGCEGEVLRCSTYSTSHRFILMSCIAMAWNSFWSLQVCIVCFWYFSLTACEHGLPSLQPSHTLPQPCPHCHV